MDSGHSLYDLTPVLRVALMGIALAAGPLAWSGCAIAKRAAPDGCTR